MVDYRHMDRYSQKRILIITIIFAVIFSFGAILYLFLKPNPSCFDKKQNQGEAGIDCGGPCLKKCEVISREKIIIKKTGFVDAGIEKSYDIYAQIVNPNNLLGAKSFDYKFIITNSQGFKEEKSGTSFVLPGDTKYVILLGLNSEAPISSVDFEIKNENWIETYNEFENYFQNPLLKVVNVKYNEVTGGVEFYETKGLVKNESPYDFSQIRVRVFLKNESGNIIAINSTEMGMVRSGENRDFRVFWPNRFSGTVQNVEIQPEVNVFNSEAFVKNYFNGNSVP